VNRRCAHGPDLRRRIRVRRPPLDDARRAGPRRLRDARGDLARAAACRRRRQCDRPVRCAASDRRCRARSRRDSERACAAASRAGRVGRRRGRRCRARVAAVRSRQGRGDRGRARRALGLGLRCAGQGCSLPAALPSLREGGAGPFES
jgi:hypothetical protein